MPWFILEVEEKTLRYVRVQARTAKAAQTAFDNDPESFSADGGSDPEYTVLSAEKEEAE